MNATRFDVLHRNRGHSEIQALSLGLGVIMYTTVVEIRDESAGSSSIQRMEAGEVPSLTPLRLSRQALQR
jgi:hypothetical protein